MKFYCIKNYEEKYRFENIKKRYRDILEQEKTGRKIFNIQGVVELCSIK